MKSSIQIRDISILLCTAMLFAIVMAGCATSPTVAHREPAMSEWPKPAEAAVAKPAAPPAPPVEETSEVADSAPAPVRGG